MKYYRVIVKVAVCLLTGEYLMAFTSLDDTVRGKVIIWVIVMVLAFTVDRPIRWIMRKYGVNG